MQFYLAPMESITGCIFRNTLHRKFASADRYMTPFIAPKQDKTLNARERRDVLPENNRDMDVVPQILTRRAEDFIRTAMELEEMGYGEVNLNLGCPSSTVVTKGKGAGFLREPDRLDAFFEQVFSSLTMKISVKTRLGMREAQEFPALMEIFNRYPIDSLIIHARVREDYYNGKPDWDAFGRAMEESLHPVVYNGDLFRPEDLNRLTAAFPRLEAVMLGRGVLANPALIRQMKGGLPPGREELADFLFCLEEEYGRIYSGEKDVLFRMKELWSYLANSFDGAEKWLKQIRRASCLADYRAAERRLLTECSMNLTEGKQENSKRITEE